jgi:hypothetical protein
MDSGHGVKEEQSKRVKLPLSNKKMGLIPFSKPPVCEMGFQRYTPGSTFLKQSL